jgi:hypothetical protein
VQEDGGIAQSRDETAADRAGRISGRRPDLRDTKGTVPADGDDVREGTAGVGTGEKRAGRQVFAPELAAAALLAPAEALVSDFSDFSDFFSLLASGFASDTLSDGAPPFVAASAPFFAPRA